MPKKKTETEQDHVAALNRFWVPLPELRTELAKLSREDNSHYPLGELLLIMKSLIEKARSDG